MATMTIMAVVEGCPPWAGQALLPPSRLPPFFNLIHFVRLGATKDEYFNLHAGAQV